MADPVDARLRAARPTDIDPDAFDADLLARLQRQPAPQRGRSGRRLALPAAGLVAAGVAAVLLISPGGPSSPSTAAAAIRQAQQWFEPAAGTILHVRSEMTSFRPDGGSDTLVQETWQSVDHPEAQRYLQSADGLAPESVGTDLFDPSTNTIYEEVPPGPKQIAAIRHGFKLKLDGAREAGATDAELARMRADMKEFLDNGAQQTATGKAYLGDPTVIRVRMLLRNGEADLGPETTHDGVRALPITLKDGPPGAGQPRWTLWTAAADGRPLELRIDNGPDTEPLQVTRWTDYDVVPYDEALLSLALSHPGARVVRDPDAYEQATARLFPNG